MEPVHPLTAAPLAPDDACCAVGLDLGGTKIAAGIVAFPSGTLIVKRLIPSLPKRGPLPVLTDCLDLARELVAEARALPLPLVGVGLAVAELVDLEGNVTSEHTFAWRAVPVQDELRRIARAVVESDVRAAALAEGLYGAGLGARLFLYITIGTGISHSLVIDGVPFPGARGNALISASSPLSTICPACGARLEPILDEIAAGPALVARYRAAVQGSAPSAARPELLSSAEVLVAAAAGDPVAVDVVRTAGEALGTTFGFLVNVLDPELVVVGGGLGLAGGLYWSNLVASTRAHIWSGTNRDLPIVPAALGADAGVVGAAATAWKRLGVPGNQALGEGGSLPAAYSNVVDAASQ
jgi:glucokinase